MKKTLILTIMSGIMLLSGCGHISEIENNRVVTACIVTKTDDEVTYSFYVSVPSGGEGGEDTGSKSSAKLYDFKSKNFSQAIKDFEKSGAYKADFTHISLFMGNKEYFNENFREDEEHIRKHISATPLMYTIIYKGQRGDFFDCIKKEYNSKPEEFAKNVFSSESSCLSCMMSELSLSVNNNYYTAVIPVIEIKEQGKNKLPEVTSATLYSNNRDMVWISDNDFSVYNIWRKNFKNVYDGYRIKEKNNVIKVTLKDTSILETAKKYSSQNYDILNVIYYSKRSFATYSQYKDFICDYNLSATEFSGGSI